MPEIRRWSTGRVISLFTLGEFIPFDLYPTEYPLIYALRCLDVNLPSISGGLVSPSGWSASSNEELSTTPPTSPTSTSSPSSSSSSPPVRGFPLPFRSRFAARRS